MVASLRNVAVLIVAAVIIQFGAGLLGVLVPLAMSADGVSAAGIGMAAALYSLGFMGGAYAATFLLSQVGHIRVVAACGAIGVMAVIAAHWADGALGWGLARMALGAATAVTFAALESWLNSSLKSSERGGVIGFYMVCTKLPLALGPFLAIGYPAYAPEPLMMAAALLALAVVPICFTNTTAPSPPRAQPLALAEQYKTAPAAVTAVFGAGLTNAAVLSFAPLYAALHYGEGSAAGFQASAWLGSLILQWPAGRLSDHLDRRIVIACLLGISSVAALALAALGAGLPFWAACLIFAVWGSGALSYYGVAVAHMADRADSNRLAQATSGLLFVWAGGSVIGPPIAGLASQALAPSATFWFVGLTSLALAGVMLWRVRAREPAAGVVKEPFANKPATSVAAAELAYGERGEDAGSEANARTL